MRVLNYRISILFHVAILCKIIFASEFSFLDDDHNVDNLNYLEVEKKYSDFSDLAVKSDLENLIKTNLERENKFLNSQSKELPDDTMTELNHNSEQIKPQSNFTSNNPLNITSFSTWDDIAAAGLWVGLFIIFGPTAIVVLVAYICCKNVCLRGNPSPLLA